jgi:hypothetical protein
VGRTAISAPPRLLASRHLSGSVLTPSRGSPRHQDITGASGKRRSQRGLLRLPGALLRPRLTAPPGVLLRSRLTAPPRCLTAFARQLMCRTYQFPSLRSLRVNFLLYRVSPRFLELLGRQSASCTTRSPAHFEPSRACGALTSISRMPSWPHRAFISLRSSSWRWPSADSPCWHI